MAASSTSSGSTTYLASTWEWNGSTWTNMASASGSPPARTEHAMAYDAAHGKVMLFGGYAYPNATSGFADTWLYGL